MKVTDNRSMAEIDRQTIEEYGVPGDVLMENAGRSSFELIRRAFPDRNRFLVWAGPGNNGGDGLVVARHAITAGLDAAVVVVRENGSSDFEAQLQRARAFGVTCILETEGSPKADSANTVLVDALSGTGLTRAHRHPELIDGFNEFARDLGVPVVSLDLPSGVGEDYRSDWPAVRADLVIFMGLPKRCAFSPAARSLWNSYAVASVGFPSDLLNKVDGEILSWPVSLPKVPRDAHKGTRGRVGVFAGARGTTGAPLLCAEAAARSGAGLVTLHLDPDIYPLLAHALRGVLVSPLAEDSSPGQFDAFAVGPGWGTGEDRIGRLEALINTGTPGVLDADGINILPQAARLPDFAGRWVLTPHPGEFRRLVAAIGKVAYDAADPWPSLESAARALNAVIVLKGAVSYVMTPEARYAILDGREPVLGTGGSGDVLAGIIAGFLARGIRTFEAACAGVTLHAQAGAETKRAHGAFLAEDLLPAVSRLSGEAF